MTRGGGTVARAGGLKRRGERLSGRDASLHCAIGRDVEDAGNGERGKARGEHLARLRPGVAARSELR